MTVTTRRVGGGLELEADNAPRRWDHEIIEGFLSSIGRDDGVLSMTIPRCLDLSKTLISLLISMMLRQQVHIDIDKVNVSASGSDGASMLVTGVVGPTAILVVRRR